MKIKEIPFSERPREKLIARGADNLSTSELLAIILQGGTKSVNANELAFLLLKEVGTTKNFLNISFNELIKIKGIGNVKAAKILATIELGKRIFLEEDVSCVKFDTAEDIYKYTKYFFYGEKQECFYCLYLDSKKKLISSRLLFKGTMTKSSVHPREVFREAYKVNASYIVCLHNHPSGVVKPSKKDIEFTKYLSNIGIIHGVLVLDHLIVSEEKYFSFLENNIMNN